MSEETPTKKKKSAHKKSETKGFNDLYYTISIIIDSKVNIQPESVKDSIVKEICKTIEILDSEVQIARDIRLREFLLKHIDNKLVSEFMDSISTLRVTDHLSPKNV
jgi:hypothetical protein